MTDDSIYQKANDYSKRYWLFLWFPYEAYGGMFDFWNSFDTTSEAIACHKSHDHYNGAMIFDSELKRDAMVLHSTKGWINLD